VLALAAIVRAVRWREVLWGDAVVPFDGDSLYHLRRSLDVAAGRGLPTFDPAVNWPYGGPVPWAPGFDLLGGAAAFLAERASPGAGALAVAWLPAALGVVAVALAMALAARAAPVAERAPAALSAGLLAALVPQAVYASRVGQTDHHVIEAILVAALAIWTCAGLPRPRRPVAWEAAGAIVSAAGVLFFTGAPLYVAIAAAVLAAAALAAPPGAPLLGRGAVGLLAGGALAAAASVPLVASNGKPLSFAFPSYLQPLLVALAGAGVAVAWAASRAGAARRRLFALGALALALALLGAAIPGVATQVARGVREWLLARDPWLAMIEEFQPVWAPAAGLARVHSLWGAAGLALPALAPVAAWAAWREGRSRAAALLAFALGMAALAVLQLRFGRPAVPALAASAGIAVAALSARAPVGPALRRWLAPALVLAALLADAAVWRAVAPGRLDKGDALVGAALDLRGAAPGEPAPGVLAPWDMGHEVNVIGGRPVVANGFGSYLDADGFAEVERAYALGERELLAWMARRRLGYAVAGLTTFYGRVPGPGSGTPLTARGDEGALDAVYLRAVPLAAAILGGSGLPAAGVPHLARLMPRYASLPIAVELPFPVPVLWTFEVVAGARVEGLAQPFARVVLEVDLVERGRPHVWQAWTDARADGRFAMVVPLPTDLVRPTLRTGSPARLRSHLGGDATLAIPESAVRGGERIEVDLVPRAAAPRPR
jgi:asparagine N-glycosylation enzyme membrane subunit Stt3